MGVRIHGKIGRAAVFEMQANIVHEPWLIAFGREVIVRPTPDDVGGQCALGQPRVASDVTPGDITSGQQRHGHADFVGLLVLIAAFYGEGADFFWGVALARVVPDETEHVRLAPGLIDSVFHGLSVERQRAIVEAPGPAPLGQSPVQRARLDAH